MEVIGNHVSPKGIGITIYSYRDLRLRGAGGSVAISDQEVRVARSYDNECPPSPANHHTVSPPLSAIIATIPFLSLHRTSANINSTYHRIQVVQLNDDIVLLHSLSRHSGSFLRPMFQQLPMSL
ncbi:hypothetical protein L2E82_23257 [Cichorium intybus]|uniref:Uncharacterized protein n=1 Tax=Cichorium intybus TaxID=13427 RepID=A0ACB9E0J4_CICIN|nr:hypothetical protein L2E82_23257 [Cichorium intybus]